MTLRTGPGEPPAGPWQAVPIAALAALIAGTAPSSGPCIVAVDGRSGGGKSTLAQRLSDAVPDSTVVHVDDIAWHAPMFGWTELLVDGVLGPLRRGEEVSYRPPAWDLHSRTGQIAVPAGRSLVIVEGVGAGRRELTELIDCLVWVQSDYAEAERLGLARDVASAVNGDPAATVAFWHAWMAAELPFLAADRPWERADLTVAGTSTLPQPPGMVLVGSQHGGGGVGRGID